MKMDWKKAFAAILPGLFLLGFNIGTGSVTAMAKAGAEHGLLLLWTVLLSCFITYRLISLYSRFTLVTGETALSGFRKWIHPGVALFFIVALTLNVSGSVMGVMGIISSVTSLWIQDTFGAPVHPLVVAVAFSAFVYLQFWSGKTRSFEKFMAILVALMGLCFALNAVLVMPSVADLALGLVPRLPEGASGNGLLVVASMVGTTVFSGLFIIRTTLIKEAGWTVEDMPKQERDAALSAFLMFAMSAAIMITAARCFEGSGVAFDSTHQMIGLLEPLAGPLAASLFTLGIVAAGLSSQFPNILLFPWLYCDYRGIERNLRRPFFRWVVGGISLLGLVVPLFGGRPILVMIASQAFGALLLPVTVGCILMVGNRRDLMGDYRLKLADNVFLVLTLLFALFMAGIGLKGLWGTIQGLLA
jgi:Mn2+/Fe2+ NRAMP family transporter